LDPTTNHQDKDFVEIHYELCEDNIDMTKLSPWLLRIELNGEMLADREFQGAGAATMKDVAECIGDECGPDLHMIFTEYGGVLRIRRLYPEERQDGKEAKEEEEKEEKEEDQAFLKRIETFVLEKWNKRDYPIRRYVAPDGPEPVGGWTLDQMAEVTRQPPSPPADATPVGLNAIANIIRNNRSLTTINILGNDFGQDELLLLRSMMVEQGSREQGMRAGDGTDGAGDGADGMRLDGGTDGPTRPTLQSLCGIADTATEADFSTRNPYRGLSVGSYSPHDANAILAMELPQKRRLTCLNLSGCYLMSDSLAVAVAVHPTLTELNISRVPYLLTKEAGKMISRMLTNTTSLKKLDISSCKLWLPRGSLMRYEVDDVNDGPGFASELAVGLALNKSLTCLNLADNYLAHKFSMDGGSFVFCETDARISPDCTGLTALAAAIKTNRSLTSLNVRGNQLDDARSAACSLPKASDILLAAVKDHPSLTSVDTSCLEEISDVGFAVAFDAEGRGVKDPRQNFVRL
jgi:hypothetical protein